MFNDDDGLNQNGTIYFLYLIVSNRNPIAKRVIV